MTPYLGNPWAVLMGGSIHPTQPPSLPSWNLPLGINQHAHGVVIHWPGGGWTRLAKCGHFCGIWADVMPRGLCCRCADAPVCALEMSPEQREAKKARDYAQTTFGNQVNRSTLPGLWGGGVSSTGVFTSTSTQSLVGSTLTAASTIVQGPYNGQDVQAFNGPLSSK